MVTPAVFGAGIVSTPALLFIHTGKRLDSTNRPACKVSRTVHNYGSMSIIVGVILHKCLLVLTIKL